MASKTMSVGPASPAEGRSEPSAKPSEEPTAADAELAARERVCELCRHLYALGWASGTGGGFSLRQGDQLYVAPSGVPKESIRPEEVFIADLQGNVLRAGHGRISACTPLFLHAYRLRGAGAVLHSHSLNACLASLVCAQPDGDSWVFRIRGLEMVKGLQGGHVDEPYDIPIIDNMPYEHELADSLEQAMLAYPRSNAILVRGHGVYIWGRDWVHTKTQAECYDYLFAASVRLREHGIDAATLGRKHPRTREGET
jgi:methylthioribulose-1-phosphate dehydratase